MTDPRPTQPIRVAIAGYGNLGRAVERAVHDAPDMELVAIFSRRDPSTVDAQFAPVVAIEEAARFVDRVDVCALCGGSATDLDEQGPFFASLFSTVDSFDTHAKIPTYFARMDEVARESSHLSVISTGWDPGLFSINRVIAEAILPDGRTETFWGRGVSQGHSDAVRRIPGVTGAVQYTVPIDAARDAVLAGDHTPLSTRDKHRRECVVAVEDGADRDDITRQIQTMPHYFSDYDTTVEFVDAEVLRRDHAGMPHGGDVIRSGETSEGVVQRYRFSLDLDSNPGFTGATVTATVRAAARLAREGRTGAVTVLDIPPAYYSPRSAEELRADLL